MLTENGFHVGKASPALFRHDGEKILGLVHGDDFLTLSDSRGQGFFESCLAKRYQYKMRGRLGPRRNHTREIRVLSRYVRWPESGDLEHEADPRHAQLIMKQLELNQAKEVNSPVVKRDLNNDGELKSALVDLP